MSSSKIKSLKLQRSSQHNESSVKVQAQGSSHTQRTENLDDQRESLTPIHSTPKRSLDSTNATQDHSTLEYRVSPILLPCTQDGGNEVAWDWQSPLTKSSMRKCRKDGETVGTPKRTTTLQKKRSSNSPILYKPLKRQLMKNDPQQESIDKFTAELRALSEQIKTAPKETKNSSPRLDKENTNDDELLIQIDISNFDGETKFELTTSDDNTSRNVIVVKTSLDDFFDDSIDDSMVKCSQEVEEKLRLESGGEGSSKVNSTNSNGAKDFSWHQQSYASFAAANNKSDDATGSSAKLLAKSKNSSNVRGVSTATHELKKSDAASATMTAGSSSASTYSRNNAKSSSSTATKNSSSLTAMSTSATSKSNISSIKTSNSTTAISTSATSKSNISSIKTSNSATAMSTSATSKSNLSSAKNPSFSTRQPTKPNISITTATSSTSRSTCFNNNAKESSKQSSDIGGSLLDDIFEIPDDSFDDFLAVCFDDVDAPTGSAASSRKEPENKQSSNRYGRNYEASGASTGNLRKGEVSTARKVALLPPCKTSGSNNVISGNSSVSNDNSKASASRASATAPQSESSTGTSQTRKFFKSKSHSTSSFDNIFVNGNTSSVSTQQKKNERENKSQNNAWRAANGNAGNTVMYNVNRNGPKEDDSIKYNKTNGIVRQEGRDVATGSQTAQICTPEEIERKRLEAKMKLEAKRKLMARSTSAGTLSGGTLKRPIKSTIIDPEKTKI